MPLHHVCCAFISKVLHSVISDSLYITTLFLWLFISVGLDMIYCTCHYYNLGLVHIWHSSYVMEFYFYNFLGKFFLHLKRLQCNLGKCLWKTEPNDSHKQCKVCIPDWMVQLHSTIISSSLNCKSLIVQVYWLLKQANIERLKNV